MDVQQPRRRASAVLHRDLHKDALEVVEAHGSYFTLSNRRKILDASGGAAVSCIGHGNQRVRKAINTQISKLDYCHSMFFANKPAEELSKLLVDSTGGQMSRVFIANSGKILDRRFDSAANIANRI